MVLKIAIVDDEPIFLNDMHNIALKFFTSKKVIPVIDVFQKHRLLLYELGEGTYYDLFLLDIEMKSDKLDGLMIAEKIREINPNALIIFVTSHLKYTINAFKVKAFRYVPKDEMEGKLPEALEESYQEIENRKGAFYSIETITKYMKLYYPNIYYIHKIGKYSIIVSSLGEYKVRKSLAVVYKELESLEFIFVERGFIVNVTHIDRMEDEKIFLDNGEVLKVSRLQVHFVKEKIAEYWSEHI